MDKRFLSVRQKNFSAITINFLVSFVQFGLSVLYLGLFAPQGAVTSLSIESALLVILAAIVAYGVFNLLYTSYKSNSTSISQVIYSFSVFISTLLGIIFFNESVTLVKLIGITLIVSAVIFISYRKEENFSKYNLYALAAAVLYGFLTAIDKAFSINIDVHYYQVLSNGAFVVVSLVLSGKLIINQLSMIDIPTMKSVLISALGFTIFNKLTYLAYSTGGEVGKVDAINNTAIFLIIILEVFVLKDRSDLRKKLIGAVVAVFGIFLLGYFM